MSNKGKCLRFRFGVFIRLLLFLGAVFIFIPLQAQTRTQVETKTLEKKPAKVQAPTGANVEEIINISKLTKEIKKFTIIRNIFSPDIMRPNVPPPRLPTREMLLPKKEAENTVEQEKKSVLEEEIRNNLSYEGYVVKDSKNIALVSLNGEFYAVGEGDMVDEKITIIIIEKETITVEFDNNIFEIQLKGDEQK